MCRQVAASGICELAKIKGISTSQQGQRCMLSGCGLQEVSALANFNNTTRNITYNTPFPLPHASPLQLPQPIVRVA